MTLASRGERSPFGAELTTARRLLLAAVPARQPVPVDLGAILDRHGVGPPLVEAGSHRHGGLRLIDGKMYPIVYRTGPLGTPLTPRERFTVAHELGHALLESSCAIRPSRASEYWALEEVCHEFAAKMLMPTEFVKRVVPSSPSASEFLIAVERTAAACRASITAASRRLVDAVPGTAAWMVEAVGTGTDYRVASTAENGVAFGITRQSKISIDHPLRTVLSAVSAAVGHRGQVSLAGTVVAFKRQTAKYVLLTARRTPDDRAPSVTAVQLSFDRCDAHECLFHEPARGSIDGPADSSGIKG